MATVVLPVRAAGSEMRASPSAVRRAREEAAGDRRISMRRYRATPSGCERQILRKALSSHSTLF
jgi:hypothetical protein